MEFDNSSGEKLGDILLNKFESWLKDLSINASFNKTTWGIITNINGNLYTIEINNQSYSNINAMRNAGELYINDKVLCLIPNNQYSNMVIIGAIAT